MSSIHSIGSDTSKPDVKMRFDFIMRVHVYTHEYIRMADTKASVILAACGFLFSGLITRGDVLGVFFHNSPSFLLTLLLVSFGVCTLLSLAFTVGSCVACIMPKLNSAGEGLIYWDQVAKDSDYVSHIADLSSEVAVEQLATHVKVISRIAQSKYKHVANALRWLCATLSFATLLSLILIYMSANSIHPQ